MITHFKTKTFFAVVACIFSFVLLNHVAEAQSFGDAQNFATPKGNIGISMHLSKGTYHILLKGHNNTGGRYRILVREEK